MFSRRWFLSALSSVPFLGSLRPLTGGLNDRDFFAELGVRPDNQRGRDLNCTDRQLDAPRGDSSLGVRYAGISSIWTSFMTPSAKELRPWWDRRPL